MIRAILTDIEGTTSSIAFVKDTLFPYAARKLPNWLRENTHRPDVRRQIEQVASQIDVPAADLEAVIRQLLDWIDADVKATPLKTLQGMLWQDGYENGDYKAHVYEDALQRLSDWRNQGLPVYIYSSGSVQAQQLFFQYSRYGDIRNLFSGYFDTTSGAKTESASYEAIASDIGLGTSDILFLSDAASEIDAATEAGMQVVLVARPEDGTPLPKNRDQVVVQNFHEIRLPG